MIIINFLRARVRKWLNEEYNLKDYIKMGMKIGKNCNFNPGLVVDVSHCWLIEIGNNVTIAPQVYILAHDASTKKYLNYTKIGRVVINDNAFIGARSIIMPGVVIGENAIVAAGSIVTSSVAEGAVVGGNPARYIMDTKELMKKHSEKMQTAIKYDFSWTVNGGITKEMKEKMRNDLTDNIGYII